VVTRPVSALAGVLSRGGQRRESGLCTLAGVAQRRSGRVEPDRLVEGGDGALELALVQIGKAATAVGSAIVRIELDRFVKIGDRAIELVLVQVDNAAAAVGSGVAGV